MVSINGSGERSSTSCGADGAAAPFAVIYRMGYRRTAVFSRRAVRGRQAGLRAEISGKTRRVTPKSSHAVTGADRLVGGGSGPTLCRAISARERGRGVLIRGRGLRRASHGCRPSKADCGAGGLLAALAIGSCAALAIADFRSAVRQRLAVSDGAATIVSSYFPILN